MKAILHTEYGPPDLLQLKEVEKPVPKNNQVLIKVFATSVTTGDCNARNFTFAPKLFIIPAKMYFGFTKPKINILGTEFAGEIEAVGKDVKLFKKVTRFLEPRVQVMVLMPSTYVCLKKGCWQ